MKTIVMRLPKLILTLLLVVWFIAAVTGCATTSKADKTEAPVSQAEQYKKAKTAFNQQKFAEAVLLLEPLAEQGHTEAQYALGYMYYNAMGVPYDYGKAVQWLRVAAAKGSKKAAEALHRLALTDGGTSDNEKQIATVPKPIPEQAVTPPGQAVTAETPAPPSSAPGKSTEVRIETKAAEPAESAEPAEPVETAVPPVAAIKDQTPLSEDEQWIMKQPAENVTIQIMATSKEAALQRFIKENDLQESAVYYQTRRNGGNWYTLIQGSFESFALAKIALNQLAPSLQAAQPWIKPMADIQQALAAR